MRFYRIHAHTEGGCSDGYLWFAKKSEAVQEHGRLMREADCVDDQPGWVETILIQPSKDGILAALQEFASHADNG